MFDKLLIGQLGYVAHAMSQNHVIELLVDLRVLNDTDERSQAGAGADEVEVSPLEKMVYHQSASGFAAHEDFVPYLNVLQARGQCSIGNLDA